MGGYFSADDRVADYAGQKSKKRDENKFPKGRIARAEISAHYVGGKYAQRPNGDYYAAPQDSFKFAFIRLSHLRYYKYTVFLHYGKRTKCIF